MGGRQGVAGRKLAESNQRGNAPRRPRLPLQKVKLGECKHKTARCSRQSLAVGLPFYFQLPTAGYWIDNNLFIIALLSVAVKGLVVF